MEDKIIDITDSSMYQEAMELHQRIMTNGTMAVNSYVEMCRCLKLMRDNKQYTYLGFETFDNYSEKMCKMKARQAYNYISSFETLGVEFLQSNANLGITKLTLLSSISESKRDELIENNDIEDLSTREMKDLIENLTKAQEQISLLTEDVEKKQEDTETAMEEKQKLEKEVEKLEKTIETLQNAPKNTPFDEEKLKKEYEKKLEDQTADLKQKLTSDLSKESEKDLKAAENKAKKEKDEAVKEAKETTAKQYQKQLDDIAMEKEAAINRSNELQKKIEISANSEAIITAHLFSEFSSIFDKILLSIDKMPEDEQPRYKEAIKKYFEMMNEKL